MDNKTLSIVSYITIIGWLISYFTGKSNANALLKYHLKQSLGIFCVLFLCNIIVYIITYIVPSVGIILSGVVSLTYFVFLLIGILNANKELEKPLPLVGKLFTNQFKFIN